MRNYYDMPKASVPVTMSSREELDKIFPHSAVERQSASLVVHGDGLYCPTYSFRYSWPLPTNAQGENVNPIVFVTDNDIGRVTGLDFDTPKPAEILLGACFEEVAMGTYFWIARLEQIANARFAMVRARFDARHQGISGATLLTNKHLITYQRCLDEESGGRSGMLYAVIDWGDIDTAAKTRLTRRYEKAVRKYLAQDGR